jgi:hypothetical protein
MECDLAHWDDSRRPDARKDPPTAATAPRDRRCDGRSAKDPAARWRQAIRRLAGSLGAWRTASREPTRSDRKRRGFGCRTAGRRSLARASRYRPGSPAAAAGRSPNARCSVPGLHCKRRGTLTSRSDQASHEDRRRRREYCRADCRRLGRDGGGALAGARAALGR